MKKLAAALAAIWLWSCDPLRVAGTDDVQDTGSVAGTVSSTDGSIHAGTAVALIPATRNPALAGPLPARWRATADSAGQFRVDSVPPGTYNLEGVHAGSGRRFLLRGIRVAHGRNVTGLAGRLDRPGSLVVSLNGLAARARDYLFLPGTTRFQVLGETELDRGQAELDSVPEGIYPELVFAQEGNPTGTDLAVHELVLAPGKSLLVNAASAWKYSRQVVVDASPSGADLRENLPDYPLLMRLSSADFDFTQAAGDGRDVRCVGEDDALLPIELQSWDSAQGRAEVWVRLDTVHAGDSARGLRILAGNPRARPVSDGHAVFPPSGGFSHVWHLSRSGASGYRDVADGVDMSVGNGPLGLDTSGPTPNAAELDGKNQFLYAPAPLPAPQTFGVSLWFKTSSPLGSRLISFGDSLPGTESFDTDRFLWLSDSGSLHFGIYDGSPRPVTLRHILSAKGPWNDSRWHYVSAMVSAVGQSLFVDGEKVAEDPGFKAGSLKAYDGFWSLGYFVKVTAEWNPMPSGMYFQGGLDEARVSAVPRSADWIKMDYATQRPGSAVVRFSGGP